MSRKTLINSDLQFGSKIRRTFGCVFCFDILTSMSEVEPDTTNVHYIDEYPELKKRVWLRRLAQERLLGKEAVTMLIPFPEPPDGAA